MMRDSNRVFRKPQMTARKSGETFLLTKCFWAFNSSTSTLSSPRMVSAIFLPSIRAA